jgi:hypothetical protein
MQFKMSLNLCFGHLSGGGDVDRGGRGQPSETQHEDQHDGPAEMSSKRYLTDHAPLMSDDAAATLPAATLPAAILSAS